jgi:hypothetical protein
MLVFTYNPKFLVKFSLKNESKLNNIFLILKFKIN